jgi:YVTN family beta-propeller protein
MCWSLGAGPSRLAAEPAAAEPATAKSTAGKPGTTEESRPAQHSSATASNVEARRRHPVALAFTGNGRRLVIANRKSGTISLIDTGTNALLAETSVGGQLSDLVAHPDDDRFLLATDEERHRLLLLREAGLKFVVAAEIAVPPYPVSVCLTGDGRCLVASLWSRRLTAIQVRLDDDRKSSPALTLGRSIPLPFAPRQQLWLRSARRSVVADSFGGKLAVIDLDRSAVESTRSLPAHNIRGLALNGAGDRLLVSHQTLSPLAHTDFEDLHWGRLMTNVAHALSLDSVLEPNADLLRESRTFRLGDVGNAAGDPAGIALLADNRIAIAYSGVGEVALLQEGRPGQKRISAGRRPTALAVHPSRPTILYAADTLGDSIAVIDAEKNEPVTWIALGPRPAPNPSDEGERLFHDARLSHDGWMSCHSCHTDGHSNGLLNDNQSDGSFDAPKRVLSLLGVADTGPWAWNGSAPDLATQIRRSVRTTMHGPSFAAELTGDQVDALAAYLRTLSPAPPRGAPAQPIDAQPIDAEPIDAAAIARGGALFRQTGCQRCHTPPAYTSADVYDVGFVDEAGNRKFNPPSLRGVSQRDTLFHDNRATSLEEAFTKHRHQIPAEFTTHEIADLTAFLRSL